VEYVDEEHALIDSEWSPDVAFEFSIGISGMGWQSVSGSLSAEARERSSTVSDMIADARQRLYSAAALFEPHRPFSIESAVRLARTQSPIERALLSAILRAARIAEEPSRNGSIAFVDGYHLFSQMRIGRYTADIAIVCPATGARIVVEADGHDYHDRTREQASRDRRRDRFMQANGWIVARFTGADIHRDADACAREVFDMMRAL
jgi:very-short-patch-repair endonuclease